MSSEYLAHGEREREGCGKRQVREGYNLTLRRSDTTTSLRFEANWHCETDWASATGTGWVLACWVGVRGWRAI